MVTLTPAAIAQLKQVLKEENAEDAAVRVLVVPAGHGVQYMLTLERETKSDDLTLEHDGLRIVVDQDSAPLLEGAEIDYVEDFPRAGFVISNPNLALGGCACGGQCDCGGH
ncbi:MAG: HesB/IscA family protein [Dehalococcoidia bacterium]